MITAFYAHILCPFNETRTNIKNPAHDSEWDLGLYRQSVLDSPGQGVRDLCVAGTPTEATEEQSEKAI